jgi:metallo-beta-lactamase class B
MKRPLIPTLAVALVTTVAPTVAQQSTDWNARGPWHSAAEVVEGDWNTYRQEPFGLFDNIYYVGLKTVSSYLVTTDEGHVLIGATYPQTADFVLQNVRSLGFDPRDIRYIVVTEGTPEQAGGAERLKEATGAQVLMSERDWDLVEGSEDLALTRDRVVEDREIIVLGGEAFKFYETPGLTPGSLTLEFMAYGPSTARAMVPGGVSLDFGPQGTDDFIRSLEWIQLLDPHLILPTRPHMGPVDIFAARDELESSEDLIRNPLVSDEKADAWLDELLSLAREKQAAERGT